MIIHKHVSELQHYVYRHTKLTGQFADKPTRELSTRRQRIY